MFKRLGYFAASLALLVPMACSSDRPIYEKRNNITHLRTELADNYLDERNGQRKTYQDGSEVHFEDEPKKLPDGKLDFSCTGHIEEPNYKCIFIIEKPEENLRTDNDWIFYVIRGSPEDMKLQAEFDAVKSAYKGKEAKQK